MTIVCTHVRTPSPVLSSDAYADPACRAARTLAYYLSETNLNVYHWLLAFMRQYPIPKVSHRPWLQIRVDGTAADYTSFWQQYRLFLDIT